MADQKRYWYRWAEGTEYIETAPQHVWDGWAASTLLREGLVPTIQQFGDPDNKPAPKPMVRYGRTCGENVMLWLKMLNEHKDVKRRVIPSNLVLPVNYALHGFIATRYRNFWEPLHALIWAWPRLVRPYSIVLDGLAIDHNQAQHQGQVLHGILSKLLEPSQTACYGPVVTARVE